MTEAEFLPLFDRYRSMVYGLALSYTRSPQDAAADGALHGNRGMLVNKALHIRCHIGSGCTSLFDQIKIQAEFAFHIFTSLPYFFT